MFRQLTIAAVLLAVLATSRAYSIDAAGESRLLETTQPIGSVTAEAVYPDLAITRLELSNGMNIYLRPTESDNEGVLFQLFAHGGTNAFPEKEYASAKFSGSIALESGLQSLSSKDLDELFFKYSLDFSARTRPFSRFVEGSCPRDSLNFLMAVIHHLFVTPQYNEKGLASFIEQSRDAALHQSYDCDTSYEDLFSSTNSGGTPLTRHATEADLDAIEFTRARRAFEVSFSSPQEFTCVFVGAFDIETIKPLLLRYFASIPRKTPSTIWPGPESKDRFPTGITERSISCSDHPESLTRITFSLVPHQEAEGIHQLEVASQILETRLRNVIHKMLGSTHGVDVGYEFPHYPLLSPLWLTIQFRSDQKLVKTITTSVLREVTDLATNDPTEEEVKAVRRLLKTTADYWQKFDSYWIATISNYLKWGWDLNEIVNEKRFIEQLTAQEGGRILRSRLRISNYTIISMNAKG